MTEQSYTAKDITVLEGLEPVRLRPGMYIGSTGSRGLHHLIYEVVDNSVDEALAGRNDRIEVILKPDNSVVVKDYGSGIPVDVMPDQGMSALTVVLTKLHAGGKFGGEGYKVSGGLHGVGVSVVNALSESLVAEVRRGGKLYRQEFARGVPSGEVEVVGKASDTGTTITFLPDSEVFDELEYSTQLLVQRLRETAFLTRGLRIVLIDERAGEETFEFHYEGGINDFVSYVNEAKDPVPQAHHLLRRRRRPGRGRGGDAVERLLRRVSLLVRQQHQHARGRLTPDGLQIGADRKPEQVRARQRTAERERDESRWGRRARGPGRGHLGQAPRPPVRGPDEDQARQPMGRRPRQANRQPEALGVSRGEPERRAPDRPEGDLGLARPPSRPQGARAHPA